MQTNEQIRKLWATAFANPLWEPWRQNYEAFLAKVQKTSDEELITPAGQEMLWSATAITELGPGGYVRMSGAFSDPEIARAVVDVRRRLWPE